MIRRARLMVLLLPLLVGAMSLAPGGVVVEGRLNSTPTPGSTTPFAITITKGGLEYFGRILISLPSDCRVQPRQLLGGGLTVDEQRNVAVISWLKLPEQDQFEISLDLEVSPSAIPGPRALEWDFSFIRNNDRVSLRPPPFLFEVAGEAEGHAQASESDVATGINSPLAPASPSTSNAVQATRSCRRLRDGGLDCLVELHHLPAGGFVKLTERIPSDCSLSVTSGGGSVVQVNGGTATFIWFDFLPAGPVHYRIEHCPLSTPDEIIGTLSIVQDDLPREIHVLPSLGLKTNHNTPAQDAQVRDVTFEIQVAAMKTEVVTDYFKRKLNFSLPLEVERDAEWFKYTTGSFSTYLEARNSRETITRNHTFIGPFVVARSGGRRVSVQEALTRTGQNWQP